MVDVDKANMITQSCVATIREAGPILGYGPREAVLGLAGALVVIAANSTDLDRIGGREGLRALLISAIDEAIGALRTDEVDA